MALTSAQYAATRRYMGYSVAGDATYFAYRELAYSDVSYMGIALDGDANGVDGRLAHLSADEETTLTTYYLANLTLREQEIQAATATLGTDTAAVWKRNKNEIADRREVFTTLRLELCSWLGFPPGSGLMTQNRLVRA